VVVEEGVAALRLRGQLSEARHPRGQLIGTVGVGVALGGGGVMLPRRGVAAVEADVPHGAGGQADRRREAREGRGVHAAEPYSQFAQQGVRPLVEPSAVAELRFSGVW
jgi:hypothetical protein